MERLFYNTGSISSHFLSHPAWKIYIFYLDGPNNSMMQRDSIGTEFPPPCLQSSSHFLVLSIFPTSKVFQCFICLKNNPNLYSILLLCWDWQGCFQNKKWQKLSLLLWCLCSFSVSSGYSLLGISGIFSSMSPFLPISACLTELWHILGEVQFFEKCLNSKILFSFETLTYLESYSCVGWVFGLWTYFSVPLPFLKHKCPSLKAQSILFSWQVSSMAKWLSHFT